MMGDGQIVLSPWPVIIPLLTLLVYGFIRVWIWERWKIESSGAIPDIIAAFAMLSLIWLVMCWVH